VDDITFRKEGHRTLSEPRLKLNRCVVCFLFCLTTLSYLLTSRGSSVITETRLRTGRPGFNPQQVR